MTGSEDVLLLLGRDGASVDRDGADEPFPLGTAVRLLTAVATCRLVERRLLDFCTVLSECLPARSRDGRSAETSLHDLLVDADPGADALLGRCLEAVTGVPSPEVVRMEVAEAAGLRATRLTPDATSTPADLDRLLRLLAVDGLLGPEGRGALLERGYGVTRSGAGALAGYGCTGVAADGHVLAHHYPQLRLTVVARGREPVLSARR